VDFLTPHSYVSIWIFVFFSCFSRLSPCNCVSINLKKSCKFSFFLRVILRSFSAVLALAYPRSYKSRISIFRAFLPVAIFIFAFAFIRSFIDLISKSREFHQIYFVSLHDFASLKNVLRIFFNFSHLQCYFAPV